jgi:hypothetical protein
MYSKTRSVIKTASGLSLTLLMLLTTSCATLIVKESDSKPGKSASAPGQVKKTTGSQSAKPYAPGQQKKKN